MSHENKHDLKVFVALKQIAFLLSVIMLFVLASELNTAWQEYGYFQVPIEIQNFQNGQIQTLKSSYKLGEPITYILEYCKYKQYPSSVTRSLDDGQHIPLNETAQGQLPIGCGTKEIDTATVPDTINPGKYQLNVQIQYEINPNRYYYLNYHTNYFNVTK